MFSYSAYFKYDPSSTTANGIILYMGFALPNATDGVNTFGATIDSIANSNNHRLLFGLQRTSASIDHRVQFVGGGRLGSALSIGDAAASTPITVGNWYQLEFSLLFNHDADTPADSTVTLSGMNLRDWGTDGVTGGLSHRSLASSTANYGFGNVIDTNNNVYAFIGGNGERGAPGFDNVMVSAIPEPGSLALMGLALGAMLLGRCRLRR